MPCIQSFRLLTPFPDAANDLHHCDAMHTQMLDAKSPMQTVMVYTHYRDNRKKTLRVFRAAQQCSFASSQGREVNYV
jgi:hypothetical protein